MLRGSYNIAGQSSSYPQPAPCALLFVRVWKESICTLLVAQIRGGGTHEMMGVVEVWTLCLAIQFLSAVQGEGLIPRYLGGNRVVCSTYIASVVPRPPSPLRKKREGGLVKLIT